MDAFVGSQWRTIRTGEAFVNGAWRVLRYGEAYIGGAWRTIVNFIPTLGLSISPTSGIEYDHDTATVTSAVYTATPSGGQAPFTYAWTGSGATINSQFSASTTFTATGMSAGETRTAEFTCNVTDAFGTTASATVDMTFQRAAAGGS